MAKSNNDVLADWLDLESFAAEIHRAPRTVRHWLNKADGLPYSRMGNRILIHIPTAREWLMLRMRKPAPRRQRQTTPAEISA
jgi:hypothetical protein